MYNWQSYQSLVTSHCLSVITYEIKCFRPQGLYLCIEKRYGMEKGRKVKKISGWLFGFLVDSFTYLFI